ncbi:MAG: WG repeat-containing protein [Bacteroidota bacterium]
MKAHLWWACALIFSCQLLSAQVLPIYQPEGRGLADSLGQTLIEPQYDDVYTNASGIHYWLKKRDKAGLFVLGQGILFPALYDQIMPLPTGGFFLIQQGKWGLADSSGKLLLPINKDKIRHLTHSFYEYNEQGLWGLQCLDCGLNRKPIYQKVEAIEELGEGRIIGTLVDGKHDIFDIYGSILAEKVPYELEQSLSNGNIIYKQDLAFGLMDSSLQRISSPLYDRFAERSGLLMLHQESGWGLTSLDGVASLPLEYDTLLAFRKIWFVQKKRLWQVADSTGNLLAGTESTRFPYLQGNVAIITSQDSLKGLINLYGEVLAEPQYKAIQVFPTEGLARARDLKDSVQQIRFDQDGRLKRGRAILVSKKPTKKSYVFVEEVYTQHPLKDELYQMGWRFVRFGGKDRWGLINPNDEGWLAKPIFHDVKILKGDKISVGVYQLETPKGLQDAYQFFNHFGFGFDVYAKKLNGPIITHVFTEDIAESRYVRIINQQGYFAIVDLHRFRYIPKGQTQFIGPFRDNVARIAYFGGQTAPFSLAEIQGPQFEEKLISMRGRWFLLNNQANSLSDSLNTQMLSYISEFRDGSAIFRKRDKWGLMNYEAEAILAPQYSLIEDPGPQFPYLIISKDQSEQEIYDVDGTYLASIEITQDSSRKRPQTPEEVGYFSEGVVPVRSGRKWSLANTEGKLLFPYKFVALGQSSEGLVPAKLRNNWGYINHQGEWVVPPRFKEARAFVEGRAAVKTNKAWGYLDPNGEWIVKPRYEQAGDFRQGGAIVKKNYWGVIDTEGKFLIKARYRKIIAHQDGYIIRNQGLYSRYDFAGNELIPAKYSWFGDWGEGLLPYLEDNACGFLDQNLEVVIEPQYRRSSHFNEGLAAVRMRSGWGYINQNNDTVIEARYVEARDFQNGVAPVAVQGRTRRDRLWGLIDQSGRAIVPPSHKELILGEGKVYLLRSTSSAQYVDPFGIPIRMQEIIDGTAHQNEYALANLPTGMLMLDQEGNSVFPVAMQQINRPAEGIVIVSQKQAVKLYDRSGEPVLDEPYVAIAPVPGTSILQLYQKGKISYLNREGNWLPLGQ